MNWHVWAFLAFFALGIVAGFLGCIVLQVFWAWADERSMNKWSR